MQPLPAALRKLGPVEIKRTRRSLETEIGNVQLLFELHILHTQHIGLDNKAGDLLLFIGNTAKIYARICQHGHCQQDSKDMSQFQGTISLIWYAGIFFGKKKT